MTSQAVKGPERTTSHCEVGVRDLLESYLNAGRDDEAPCRQWPLPEDRVHEMPVPVVLGAGEASARFDDVVLTSTRCEGCAS
ncbi:MAG TPA: hypothetical protein VK425_03535 [Acidimicrobiales bacterium]|nr:hypothetical protein [Acidimicrobiales bacterium]